MVNKLKLINKENEYRLTIEHLTPQFFDVQKQSEYDLELWTPLLIENVDEAIFDQFTSLERNSMNPKAKTVWLVFHLNSEEAVHQLINKIKRSYKKTLPVAISIVDRYHDGKERLKLDAEGIF